MASIHLTCYFELVSIGLLALDAKYCAVLYWVIFLASVKWNHDNSSTHDSCCLYRSQWSSRIKNGVTVISATQLSFINISLSLISSKHYHQLKVNNTNPELLYLLNAAHHHLLCFFFFFCPCDWLSLPFLANTMLITLVYSQNISRESLSLSHEGRREEKSYGGRFSPSLSSQPWRAWLLTTMNMGFVINICSSGIGPRPNHPSHLLFLHKKRGNQGHHLAAGWNY